MAALTVEFPQTVWTVEFGGDEVVVAPVTMAPGAPGGGGVTVHNDLTGRSDPDAHPISSITGLSAALAAAGNVDSVNGQTGTVVLDLDDLTDVDTTTDPPDADDVLAWDGVMWTPATLQALGAPDLSNATPADLGVAAPGVASEASRADHVHDMPSAADVGAAASLHSHSGADITSGTVSTARLGTGAANATTFLRGDQTWATPSGIADPGGSNDDFLQRKSDAWTNRTVAQVKADLGVQHVLSAPVGLWTGPVSGNTVECHQADLFLSASGRGSASLVRLAAGTYDRVAVSVQSVGAATIRLGLWAADPTTGMPGDLVLDAGTISVAGSAGLREITINQTLSGWYWCSVSCDAYTSAFTMWGIGDTASSPIFGMPVATSDIRIKSRNALTSESFGSGGLPSTFPTQGAPQASGPKLIFRRSA